MPRPQPKAHPIPFPIWYGLLMQDANHYGFASRLRMIDETFIREYFWREGCAPTIEAYLAHAEGKAA